METSRRSLLRAGLVAGAATAVPATWWDATRASAATPPLPGTPFTLGVASGDPGPTASCSGPASPSSRWRRTARAACPRRATRCCGRWPPTRGSPTWSGPEPRSPGPSPRRGPRRARGLEPGREYWYRFRQGRHLSRTGRAHTAPPAAPCRPRWRCRSCPARSSSTATSPPTAAWPRTAPTWSCTSATTSTSTRRTPTSRPAATPATTRAGDHDAGRLPAAARPVQDRPRPPGGARGGALAGGVGRPRAGQQLGRRDPREGRDRLPGPARRRLPRLLREHAAALELQAPRHRPAAVPARALG